METLFLSKIIEALLIASAQPLSLEKMQTFFEEHECPSVEALQQALAQLQEDTFERAYELIEVSTGFRFQVKQRFSEWASRLSEEKPARYSRALLETLALIAYRQPITRGEIEAIRGVAVSTNIIKTLHEHEWIRVVGHKECPGRPALYATSKYFLDHFNLKSLDELPALSEIEDLDKIQTPTLPPSLEAIFANNEIEHELEELEEIDVE